jgi:hypothetical protein
MDFDHSKLEAWALCWPGVQNHLLYMTKELAEQDRAWFSKNFKTNRDGIQRGEPFILKLAVKQNP